MVPPLNFDRLFAFLMPGHGRRKPLWFEVTRHPTAEREAMGIRDRPISPGSPWQNPYVERLIGTVRRECLDQMLVFGEAHLRQILSANAAYYNQVRTHLALAKERLSFPKIPSGTDSRRAAESSHH